MTEEDWGGLDIAALVDEHRAEMADLARDEKAGELSVDREDLVMIWNCPVCGQFQSENSPAHEECAAWIEGW